MATDDEVDDFLAHYGVKGMKWGVRKKREGTFKERRQAKKAAREERDNDIVNARVRQAARLTKLQMAEAEFYVARTAKGEEAAEKVMRKLEKEYFTNDDFQKSQESTRGEKVLEGIQIAAGLTTLTMAALVFRETGR